MIYIFLFIKNNILALPTFSKRLDLHTHALNSVEKEGLYLEFGVYVGISINHIAKQRPNAEIYGFDSFEGLPESWYGKYEQGHFKMDKLPDVEPNVTLVKGYFDDTLPQFVQEKGDFDVAYLNIDCDLYSSTKTIFNCLKGHISKGTVIYFDEYCEHIRMIKELSDDDSLVVDLNEKTDLIGAGILDSLSMMMLISKIEDECRSIEIEPDDITPENFQTVEAIVRYLDGRM